MRKIGMATIGQSPRDDLVPSMQRDFTAPAEILQRGALDGLTTAEIERLGPDPGEVGIVAPLPDGSSTLLSHAKIFPRMQQAVNDLVDAGCQFVVILCGADWSQIRSRRLIVNPGTVFPSVISALARGRRLGIVKPSAGQVEQERERYERLGIDAIVTSVSPYTGDARLRATADAARLLREQGAELVWMTCVGMDEEMRAVMEEATGLPVILARRLLARIVDALLGSDGVRS